MFTAALWGSCLIWLHGQEGKLGEASDLLKVTEAVNGGGPVETEGRSSDILCKDTGQRVTTHTRPQTPFPVGAASWLRAPPLPGVSV